MNRAVRFTLVTVLAWAFLGGSAALADYPQWQVDIGYADLASRPGFDLPGGQGIGALMVEAGFLQDDAYMPNLASSLYIGKAITDLSSVPGVYSWHANEVAKYLVGNNLSMTDGILNVGIHQSDDFLANVLHQSSLLEAPELVSGYQVVNHSWVDEPTSQAQGLATVGRFDYWVSSSGLFAAVGVRNIEPNTQGNWTGYDVPPYWGWSRNSIAVGVSSAYSSHGPSSLGTAKPEIVATVRTAANIDPDASKTSWTTAVVSSAGAMLIDGSNFRGWQQGADPRAVKAMLMAGATKLGERTAPEGTKGTLVTVAAWQKGDATTGDDEAHPLDWYQGAGQLNVANSWDILRVGRQEASPDKLLLHTGYDLQTLDSDGSQAYFFRLASPAESFSAILTWFAEVEGIGENDLWSGEVSLADLDLRFYSVADGEFVTGEQIQASLSTADNVEHIWLTGLDAGQYALVVEGGLEGDAYALAWQSMAELLDGDANGDGTVDLADLGALATNWDAASGAAWVRADYNGDGKVDLTDLGILASNWGASVSGVAGSTVSSTEQLAALAGEMGYTLDGTVPEPATLSMLAVGAAAMLRRRRRA